MLGQRKNTEIICLTQKLLWRFESRLNKTIKMVGKAKATVGKSLGNNGALVS